MPVDLARLRPYVPVLAIAAAWWLLADHAAVWGPSLITIFGQASETPAELMGAFALGCVLASFPLARAARDPRGAWAVLAIALVARVVLGFAPGGQVQLWAASAGIAASLAWFATLVCVHGRRLAPGLALGWLATSTVAALGGTWLPVWRPWAFGIAALVALVCTAVGTAGTVTAEPAPPGRRQAWSLMPVALVAGVAVVNAGRASAVDPRWGPALLVLGCATGVALALRPARRGVRLLAAVLAVAAVAASLYGTTGEVSGTLGAWTLVAFVVGPPALLLLLGEDAGARPARPAVVLGGAVVWVLLLFVYYAGYDLGYRADAVLLVATVALGVLAVLGRTDGHRTAGGPPWLVVVAPLAAVVVLAAALTPGVPDEVEPVEGRRLDVIAWNLRMGYGMTGVFDPGAVAAVVEERDVVLLSEIDRGWLLNGGQDQLAVLARLTGKRLYFAPAADPVWGDAVLTSLPVNEVRGVPLESYGAVTGAGALAVQVEVGGKPVWVVSTHVQPTTTRDDGTLDQARDLADLATELSAEAPVVLGGDLNFEPDTPSFTVLLDAGLVPSTDGGGPDTFPADDPEKAIDHLFVSDGLTVAGNVSYWVPLGPWPSDHQPISTTVRVDG
ncbi:MAG: endonuclease/exonuclease/phosphatase family protein [Nocardioides sp.]|uniref:endonuclease/exonuclease/phosphatase family protein n=1 Tax=Nocardioides sp. TaxID=35761 RepID=UPI003F129CD9